ALEGLGRAEAHGTRVRHRRRRRVRQVHPVRRHVWRAAPCQMDLAARRTPHGRRPAQVAKRQDHVPRLLPAGVSVGRGGSVPGPPGRPSSLPLYSDGPVSEPPLPWVPVLLYHRVVDRMPEHDPAGNCVTARTFETHLRWLARRGYRSMTVSEVVRPALHDRGQSGLRVAITFDDGYEDNLIHELPLLERFGFTATVFVITDVIGSLNHFDSHLGGEPVRMLSAGQVRSLADAGLEVGSHTCTPPHSLPLLVDSALDDQLRRSRSVLEGILGRRVRS